MYRNLQNRGRRKTELSEMSQQDPGYLQFWISNIATAFFKGG
jgi:hypothetical protein